MARTELDRWVAPAADDDAEQALIERWIYLPRYQPNEPRLVDYHVEVWALVGYARGTDGDLTIVARDYDLPLEAVQAAIAYYHRYPLQIDARLEANEALLAD